MTGGYAESIHDESSLRTGVHEKAVDSGTEAQEAEQQDLLRDGQDVNDHHVPRSPAGQVEECGEWKSDLLSIGEHEIVVVALPIAVPGEQQVVSAEDAAGTDRPTR